MCAPAALSRWFVYGTAANSMERSSLAIHRFEYFQWHHLSFMIFDRVLQLAFEIWRFLIVASAWVGRRIFSSALISHKIECKSKSQIKHKHEPQSHKPSPKRPYNLYRNRISAAHDDNLVAYFKSQRYFIEYRNEEFIHFHAIYSTVENGQINKSRSREMKAKIIRLFRFIYAFALAR